MGLLRRKYAPEVRRAKGFKQCRVTVKGVNNAAGIMQQLLTDVNRTQSSVSGRLVPWTTYFFFARQDQRMQQAKAQLHL